MKTTARPSMNYPEEVDVSLTNRKDISVPSQKFIYIIIVIGIGICIDWAPELVGCMATSRASAEAARADMSKAVFIIIIIN